MGFSNHLHPDPEMGRVDLIYVDTETAEKLFRSPGATLRLGERELRVPRAEHLAGLVEVFDEIKRSISTSIFEF